MPTQMRTASHEPPQPIRSAHPSHASCAPTNGAQPCATAPVGPTLAVPDSVFREPLVMEQAKRGATVAEFAGGERVE
jgi:hypothetical protein